MCETILRGAKVAVQERCSSYSRVHSFCSFIYLFAVSVAVLAPLVLVMLRANGVRQHMPYFRTSDVTTITSQNETYGAYL